VNQPESDSDD
jgi:transposase InsO family protein